MKKYILRSFVFISLSTLIITGCSKWLENEFIPIPASNFPFYEIGDTFIYRNIASDDLDTFVVQSFRLDTFFSGSFLFESSEAWFTEIQEDTLSDNFFLVVNEPSGILFIWDSVYANFSSAASKIDTTIQGFDYTDLFHVSNTGTDTSINLYRIFVDWNYGLIKYTYRDRSSYELFHRPE